VRIFSALLNKRHHRTYITHNSPAFATLEDQKAFKTSEWAQAQKAKYEAAAAGPPLVGLFKVADFPKDASPKKFTQFSRITICDESKHEEARKAWEDLMGIIGKESWGGMSVGEGEHVGLGLVGWDSLEVSGLMTGNF
jgi:hypothetical protein